MTYKDLYEYCQGQANIPISTRLIAVKLAEMLPHEPFRIIESGLDTARIRGYFVPSCNTDHQFVKQTGGGNVVVIARDLDASWKRFVKVKELMHLFDKPLEVVNARADFDTLLDDFFGSQNPQEEKKSPFYQSESKAFWMALALFCPESIRVVLASNLSDGKKVINEIAQELRLPVFCVTALLHDDFKKILTDILDC